MGCDIHFFVEKKINGVWVAQDTFFPDPDDESNFNYDYKNLYYTGRNYNLFAILADVRNGYGFAGVKTGEGFKPIAKPRGVPNDASREYLAMVERYGPDGHSHSYLTLRELLEYNWTRTTHLEGFAPIEDYLQWTQWGRQNGEGPSDYCGDVAGPNVKKLTPAEKKMAEIEYSKLNFEGRKAWLIGKEHWYAHARWEVPYYIAAGEFWKETMPRLMKLAGNVADVDDVRVVFYFDN